MYFGRDVFAAISAVSVARISNSAWRVVVISLAKIADTKVIGIDFLQVD
jgi:hypothetical protein